MRGATWSFALWVAVGCSAVSGQVKPTPKAPTSQARSKSGVTQMERLRQRVSALEREVAAMKKELESSRAREKSIGERMAKLQDLLTEYLDSKKMPSQGSRLRDQRAGQ